ncbi:MAG: hemolysin family protein [Pirellulales bacterium]
MSVTVLLVIMTLLAVVLAGFASAVAKAFEESSLAKLEELALKQGKSATFDSILAGEERAALAAESLRVLFTVVAASILTWWLTHAWHEGPAPADVLIDVLWLAGFVLALWAALIWIPSAVARIWAEPLILASWPFCHVAAKLLSPALIITRLGETALRRVTGHPEAPSDEEELEEELKSIVTEGHREGFLEEEARDMIESVIELGDVSVAEIMTPRTYMISLHEDMPWDEVVRFVIESGHTRSPVYGRTRDEIVGVLHAKDVLAELARPAAERRPLEKILRKPFFVPETKKVDELLPEFQKSRNHIAIVLDEFGSVSGLVTIEDVIEEIVGEIADEYDEALVDGIKCTSDTACEALARVHIEEINRRLGISLPEDKDFDTVGGFLFHELGRIPDVGEEVTYGDVRFRILDAGRRRIDRVAIEVLRPQAENVGE